MGKRNKIDINLISYRVLIYNFYLTQAISLIVSLILFVLFFKGNVTDLLSLLMPDNILKDCLIAILFVSLIVLANIFLVKILPRKYLDDGGINKKLFINTPVWHIAIISVIVSFTEELLFRVFIQIQLGVIITSVIFALIHFRYNDKLVLILFTFFTSILLGYLVVISEWFTAFLAHALIDFTLGVFIRLKLIEY